jgi:ABC-type glycerol-3-phosphate transport system substrate-binding protein
VAAVDSRALATGRVDLRDHDARSAGAQNGSLKKRSAGLLGAGLALVAALSVFVSGAGAERKDVTTVTLLDTNAASAADDAVIASFERAFPNVVVKPTYLSSTTAAELTGLRAGTAPDIMVVGAGAGVGGQTSVWQYGPQYFADLTNDRG